jgi:hypothetical protein
VQVTAANKKHKPQSSKRRWKKPRQPSSSPVFDSYPVKTSTGSLTDSGMGLLDGLLGPLKQKFEAAMEAAGAIDSRVPRFDKEFSDASSSGNMG